MGLSASPLAMITSAPVFAAIGLGLGAGEVLYHLGGVFADY
ncbi:hypothetical protein P186_2895 [Pyrobaculum ferrireducens]|uniref:Uncharacterized protein n=1 Tax=Pyrobaculum ferrireducens TaxID=1104324 RepID=G7VFR5_9CREN|nr:hypothetical protein P186_2895 [Pyrobaculum ferrireducens]